MKVERRAAREVRAMTVQEVVLRAMQGRLTWSQAADIIGVTPRHMRRMKRLFEIKGYDGIVDHRGSTPRRKRIRLEIIDKLCRLKREKYADYSVQHFWEKVTEHHGINIG